MNSSSPPPSILGTPTAKAALQALGKRIIENSTLYHFGKAEMMGANAQLPPKKQKMDPKGTDKIKDEGNQRDPYLSYEQYENLLYRGKHPQLAQQLPKTEETNLNEQIPIDSLISDLPYDDSNNASPLSPTALPTTLSSPLSSPIDTALASLPTLGPITSAPTPPPPMPIPSPPTALTLVLSQPPTPPSTAHAVQLLTTAENQKIQRKKANQQERELLEKYYNDHYVDQSVKIRKEDLTELSFSLNWHVLRVQGWMHTHRQSRSDYNPPKRTKRRATLPQEQDLLKNYFKLWTEQGLIDLHSPTRVTPKDYEVVATQLGWDNERVRRWTDHYKQKIKAATEGNP